MSGTPGDGLVPPVAPHLPDHCGKIFPTLEKDRERMGGRVAPQGYLFLLPSFPASQPACLDPSCSRTGHRDLRPPAGLCPGPGGY